MVAIFDGLKGGIGATHWLNLIILASVTNMKKVKRGWEGDDSFFVIVKYCSGLSGFPFWLPDT